MSDLCTLSECTLMYFIQFSFFRQETPMGLFKRFHITPLDGSLPLFVGNDTRFTRFDAIFPREFSTQSELQKDILVYILVLKHGWTIRQMEVVPHQVRVSRF